MRFLNRSTACMLAVGTLFLSWVGCGRGPNDVVSGLKEGDVSQRFAKSMQLPSGRPAAVAENSGPWDVPALDPGREEYRNLPENRYFEVLNHPQSTFSIDVDTASYSNVRRILKENRLPEPGAVRIEEMLNYFSYDYPQPTGAHPFSVLADVAVCPWNQKHQLVRVALKGKEIKPETRHPANLVFLLDVSGSMGAPNKLPLVKTAMKMLVNQLDHRDSISIVVYAGSSGLVLPPTSAGEKSTILDALTRLQSGGSTNGGQGIQLAYRTAEESYIEGGINRVVLCTDGDFNVGLRSRKELENLIQEKARSNVFLSVLGFGTGNLKDASMEALADRGNGNFGYIDSLLEAQKILVDQVSGTLVTIAKDVKIQVDFNPARIQSYRLLGYENRVLDREDFEDDSRDAGEIGAGHSVTALYEVRPRDFGLPVSSIRNAEFPGIGQQGDIASDQLLNVAVRYKHPEDARSLEMGVALRHSPGTRLLQPSAEFRFAAAVAAYGMLLKRSDYAGDATMNWVVNTALENKGEDARGFRSEFIELAKRARALMD
ncbi:MAG: VWA domain-containing protein [Planctomycetota bacterium]|nr:VWA domain-containing protein [Planctomycetota bacterium]